MAYAAGEWLVHVKGHSGTAEIWDNSWCFIDPTGSQSISEPVARLSTFYSSLHGFASWFSSSVGSDAATAKDLATGLTQNLSWAPTVGSSASNKLPQQLGTRVSLKSAFANGGPYICGQTINAVGVGGIVVAGYLTDFTTAWNTFVAGLTTDGWQLGLDQPTAGLATQVTGARIGNRFDVIRKRANDIVETYSTLNTA